MNDIVRGSDKVGGISNSLIEVIARAATDPRVDIPKMKELLDMQERILAKESEVQFNEALDRVNDVALRVGKHGTASLGGKGSYKFAKWEDMDSVIRPLLRANGLRLSFDTETNPSGGLIIEGKLTHRGGFCIKASIPLTIDTGPGRNPLQQMGSTISYGKRYVTEMLLNIVREDEDDDGRAGGERAHQARQTYRTALPPTAQPQTFTERADQAIGQCANATQLLKLLPKILEQCPTLDDLAAIKGHGEVKKLYASAALIRSQMDELYRDTVRRLMPMPDLSADTAEPEDADIGFPGDRPIEDDQLTGVE